MIRRLLFGRSREVASPQSVAPEQRPAVANRVVVYGTNLSGARAAAIALQACMEQTGVANPSVTHIRYVDSIESAFFYAEPPTDPNAQRTLPRGVVIFPDMRITVPSGTNFTMPTPVEHITELCTTHDVPYALIGAAALPQEITAAFSALGSETPPPLPPAA